MKATADPGAAGRTRLTTLAAACLLIGFAEALGAFFIERVRGESGPVWLAELLYVVIVGTLAAAGFAALLGVALRGIGRLVRGSADGPSRRRASGDRLGGVPVLVLVYLAVGFALSSNALALRIGVPLVLLLLAGAYVRFGVPRFAARVARWWPPLVGLLVSVDVWFALGALARKRFAGAELATVLLFTALPVLLLALGGVVGGRGGPARRVAALALAAALAAGALWLAAPPRSTKAALGERPNVLLIVVDTLRADRVWGDAEAMPRLKQLAGQGAYYTSAFASIAKTQQSVSSIMTGRFPWELGVRELHDVLDPGADTLAEKLSRAGYRTAAFVHNPWIDYGMGHQQGFYEYYDYSRIESLVPLLHRLLPIKILDYTVGRKRGANKFQTDGRQLTDRVLAWLESAPDEPYFIWVHYFDPHWPYLPPAGAGGAAPQDYEVAAPVNGKRGRIARGEMIFHADRSGVTAAQIAAATRLYSGEVRHTDQQIARILDHFAGRAAPLVLVTADHGESLGEHDYHFHHGELTYDVCLRVPLVVAWPGEVDADQVIDAPVSLVDVMSTLASLAGVDPGDSSGRPLPGVPGGGGGDPSRVLPFESDVRMYDANERIRLPGIPGKWRGVMRDGGKLIAIPGEGVVDYELYDLPNDPGEVNNLYAGGKQAAAPLIAELERAGLSPGGETDTVDGVGGTGELSAEEIERLRSLGYVQ